MDKKVPLIYDELLNAEAGQIRYEISGMMLGKYTKKYETWKRTQNILRFFRRELARRQGSLRVVDIGCGNGLIIFLLNTVLGAGVAWFHGVDISPARISLACTLAERFGLVNTTWSVADATVTGLADSSVDIILCIEVIEHIARSDIFLQELMRLLKPGGAVIVTTPNGDNLIRRLRLLFGPLTRKEDNSSPYIQAENVSSATEHISIKSYREWEFLFRQAGFLIEECRRGSLFSGGAKFDRFPLFFSASIILDYVFDCLPFTRGITENITFLLKKPHSR